MGLLDQINEVLNVTPRKYWGEKANRLGSLLTDAASTGAQAYGSANGPLAPEHSQTLAGLLADFTPGLGDVKSAYDGVQSAREGDYLGAALGGLGALPMVPNLGGMIKGGKIVGENGKPLTLYHGTRKDISAFDEAKFGDNTGPGSLGPGVYVSELPWHSELYASGPFGSGSGANIMPLNVDMKNPYIFDGTKKKIFGGNTVHPLEAKWWENGYDGAVIYRPGIKGKEWEIIEAVVKSPKQIKSTITGQVLSK